MTVWAFLDESGDPNVGDAAGSSTHFAIAAVVVPDSALEATRAAVERVRQEHFQTGPIKSRTVAANLRRRLAILTALHETGYRMLGLIVDKRRLRPESGLRFRPSFMKYINRFLYERLYRAYPDLQVRADRHGRPEFMESFGTYLLKHHPQGELFATPPTIEFVDSKTEVLVQVADFVSGSLRIAYSDGSPEDAGEILGLLRSASFGIQEWPPTLRLLASVPVADDRTDHDELVRRAAERSACAFIAEEAEKDDDFARMRVEALYRLLDALRFEDSTYVSADALAESLRERGFRDCDRDDLRRSLIAPMRDREVLIVSSSKGYGLASCLADIETYVRRMEDEVRPILRRVQTMDTLLKRVSLGQIELLTEGRFAYLRRMLDVHRELERGGDGSSATTAKATA